MKKIFFTVIFLFAFSGVFAKQTEKQITKETLQEQYSQEITVLTKELSKVKTEQITANHQNQQSAKQDVYYQTFFKAISAAIERSIQQNQDKISGSFLKEYPEYAQAIQHYDQFYKSLNTKEITSKITAYSKKVFPNINKMQKIYAACFSDSQMQISFVYDGQSSQIFYHFDSGYISHIIAQKNTK